MFRFDKFILEENRLEYILSIYGLLVVLVIAIIITLLTWLFKKLTFKNQNIMLYIIGAVLAILEIGRITWHFLNYYHINGTLAGTNWAWTVSFQMCAQMVWFTVYVLLFRTHKKEGNTIFYSILFGQAMLGAILAFGYIDMIDNTRHLYHFTNWQTLVTHGLLILVPCCLIVSKRVTIRLKNIWMPIMGALITAVIALIMSLITDNNFMYMMEFNLVGIKIPWNYPILLTLMVILELILFVPFELVYRHKIRKNNMN